MTKVIDDDYWKQRWIANNIGFHRKEISLIIIKHVDDMTAGQEKTRIFMPLCGKSGDMKWLADRGHSVVGVELSAIAIEDFFKENNVDFTSKPVAGLTDMELYTSKDSSIEIYNGDIFDLNRDILGEFDCIWDRASLVALPRELIQRYADLMTTVLKPNGRCLLEALEYDQSKMDGPPFSTPEKTVKDIYEAGCWDINKCKVFDALTDKWRSRGLDDFKIAIYLLVKR